MTRYPSGIDLINKGIAQCGASPVACMFCTEGHMLECHFGMDCYEAQCDHLLQSTGGE